MFFKNNAAENRLFKYCQEAGLTQDILNAINPYLIFGGATRDALTGEETCNDIDIMTTPDNLKNILKKDFVVDIREPNASSANPNLTGIAFKIKDMKIDIMVPKTYNNISNLFQEIGFVDFNISSIAFNFNIGFVEVIPGALSFIERKIIQTNLTFPGFTEKSEERKEKLIKKGWLFV